MSPQPVSPSVQQCVAIVCSWDPYPLDRLLKGRASTKSLYGTGFAWP